MVVLTFYQHTWKHLSDQLRKSELVYIADYIDIFRNDDAPAQEEVSIALTREVVCILHGFANGFLVGSVGKELNDDADNAQRKN